MRGMALICGAIVVVGGLLLAGCGSDSSDRSATTESTEKAAGPGSEIKVPASFSGCPQGRQSYVMGTEIIEESEAALEDGEGKKTTEEYARTGQEMVAQSYELCESEKELASAEAGICKNTPKQLAEALEVEDTPGNREYISVFEVTCGKKVPIK